MSSGKNGKARVRVFVDYSNFARRWESVTKSSPHENFKWDAFPGVILDHLARMDHVSAELEMRAIKIYASVKPFDESHPENEEESLVKQWLKDRGEEGLFKKWLQDDLDQLPGYTVDISMQINDPVACSDCGHSADHFVERGVDTKIAIDLLALATRDLYDIGVLVSEDSDLVPSTKCVQDVLDKHIVHLGFAPKKRIKESKKDVSRKDELRASSWGHLLLDDMLPALLR
ncbi:MAG TPA: NYN domain-containing protein [Allosphingosinicella sp.]|nr:NYN domain-containing protein [Allosphingosinicella sp.]